MTPLSENEFVHKAAAEIGKSVYCRQVFVRVTDESAVIEAGFVRRISVVDYKRLEQVLRQGIEVKGAELIPDGIAQYTLGAA